MNTQLRTHADQIIQHAIHAVLPDAAVKQALDGQTFPGRVILVAAGKAGWQMAKTAWECLGDQICDGIVITKYEHVKGPIGNLTCLEAGHPVPDKNSFTATRQALQLVHGLTAQDTVLFLLSGGGSALFEDPLIPEQELQDITRQLLACGADITQMNTIRKRLSRVKGGRFAQACAPAQVYTIVLSDIVGDPLDMIASGPAYPDSSTCVQALQIAKDYNLQLSSATMALLSKETPKQLNNVVTHITGSVQQLVNAAADACRALGYSTDILSTQLQCQAKEAGAMLANKVLANPSPAHPMAFLVGGETVVKLTGNGKGGRNQELALSAAPAIAGRNACIFSVGSDGTDGPTDAAGGYIDGDTAATLAAQNIDIAAVLQNNDSYHALQHCDGLIITGPTGTNVNDVAIALLLP